MIEQITIRDPQKTPIPYWNKVPWLAALKTLKFKPGLNIIIGPNGSGKSTLLKALAKITHCHQSGVSTLTDTSCQELFQNKTLLDGITLTWNGKPAGYFSPEETPGLIGGMAGFDYDFLDMGLQRVAFRGSSGENTLQFMTQTVERLIRTHEIPNRSHGTNGADFAFKETRTSSDIPTLFVDEPERAVSLPLQCTLWQGLENIVAGKAAKQLQIIVASHSPLCLFRKAHYIETEPEFKAKARSVMLMEAIRAVAFIQEITVAEASRRVWGTPETDPNNLAKCKAKRMERKAKLNNAPQKKNQ